MYLNQTKRKNSMFSTFFKRISTRSKISILFILGLFGFLLMTSERSQNLNNFRSNFYKYLSETKFLSFEKKVILIVSGIRSGSTFLGGAISAHPGVYYHFEPLLYRFLNTELYKVSKNQKDKLDAVEEIRNFVQCHYEDLKESVEIINGAKSFVWKMNNKLDGYCFKDDPINTFNTSQNYNKWLEESKQPFSNFYNLNKSLAYLDRATENKCIDLDFLSSKCNQYPVQAAKIVRLPVGLTRSILENDPNSYVVYLIRDPRGNFLSRSKVGWCYNNCLNMKMVCDKLEEDFESYLQLKNDFGEARVILVKYEHLSSDPYKVLKNLFEKFSIGWNVKVQEFLDEHTKAHKPLANYIWEGLNTYKNSSAKVDSWKKELNKTQIDMVEADCSKTIYYYSDYY